MTITGCNPGSCSICSLLFSGVFFLTLSLLINRKLFLTDHLYPGGKHFYRDGTSLFHADSAPIHKAKNKVSHGTTSLEQIKGLTQWPSRKQLASAGA